MILELAEAPRRKSKYITVDAYKRKSTVSSHKRRRPVLNSGDNHIYIPPHLNEGYSGVWVREDKFDGLSDSEWHSLMDELLEYDPMLNGLSGKGKEKRKAKRAARAARKKEKWERRQMRRDLRTASKAQKRLMKAGKGGDDSEPGEGNSPDGGGSILDTIINKGTDLIDKVRGGGRGGGGGGGGSDSQDAPDGQEGDDDSGSAPKKQSSSDSFNIFGMDIPKMVVYVGGAAIVGTGIYLATKKKK